MSRRRNETPREPPVVAGRVPPHDLDAEASVLSAAMLDADACDEVVALIEPQHFYSDSNRLIAEVCKDLRSVGQPADVTTVAATLRQRDQLQRAGGSQYLAQVVDATPAVANVAAHCEIVWSRWRQRRVIAEAQWIAAMGYSHEIDVDAYLAESDSRITNALSPRYAQKGPEVLRDTLVSVMRELQSEEPRTCRTTGLVDLDSLLGGGLENGDLTIVAARPGMGKTSFLDHLEIAVAEQFGLEVLSWTGEMPKEQRAIRKLCGRARVDLRRYREKRLSTQDWTDLASAGGFLGPLPIEVDDTPEASITHITSWSRRRFRRAVDDSGKRKGLGLITGDHLGIMHMRDPADRNNSIGDITRCLKNLAKELNVPVVWLSQLNRVVESRNPKNKRPTLADLRDSGSIEQDADNIIFLYRDEYYNRDTTQDRGIAEFIVAKQRNGPTGTVKARFVASSARFENLAPGEYDEEDRYE